MNAIPPHKSLRRLGAVAKIVGQSLNPQLHPGEMFAHYSIPAFDEGEEPVRELGQSIKSNKILVRPDLVLFSKLNPRINRAWVTGLAVGYRMICSTEFVPLEVDSGQASAEYIAWYLRSDAVVHRFRRQTSAATKSRERVLPGEVLDLRVPLPALDEQRRIVDILDRAASIRRLRRQAEETARQIVPALFDKMFGDPMVNPRGWPIAPLSAVADVASGVSKGRRLNGGAEVVEVPYLRVANVQDGFLNLDEVKTIQLRLAELDRFQLLPGDLLMTEGGDPDKLGRGAIWSGQLPHCAHQNHVFRVRADHGRILPHFLACHSGSPYGKGYFLQVAKRTTGIASINKAQLSAFPVLLPPLVLQAEFEQNLEEFTRIAVRQSAAEAVCENAAQTLQTRLFS